MLSRILAAGLFTAALAAACAGSSTSPASAPATPPSGDAAVVLNVVPAARATGVDPKAPIVITFNHAMFSGMEMLVLLHETSVTGPTVPGTGTWSADRTTLTFTPTQPLQSNTTYVLHLSPNLKDASGNPISFAACAQRLGGQSPSGLGFGGMMGGGMGPGMMGNGWQAGTGQWGYGMIFTFTTA
ncbi:MAG TPA: Ig-like domain-containing protein [Gemmatimonadaceae bacterium]|nr:Ig-like domain-containing protein [Gemmatimonadaceae bacterium]